MKPVKLEMLFDNKTADGFKTVGADIEDTREKIMALIAVQKSYIENIRAMIAETGKSLSTSSDVNEVKKLSASLVEAEGELKDAEFALALLEKTLDESSNGAGTLRTQIMNLKNDMAKMAEGTDEYRAAMEKLGQMQDQYGDITQQGRVLADDEKNIRATADAVAGLSGAMSAGVGIASLFGMEQEKLAQIQTRLQAVMAITIGVQQVAQTLNKDSYFSIVLLTGAKKKWAAAQTILNTQLGIGVGLSKALMVSGIGLLLAGIASLVVVYDKWKKKQEEINKLKQEFTQIEIDTAKAMAGEKVKMEQLHKIASDQEKTLLLRNKAIEKIKSIMPEYNGHIDKEGVLVDNANTALKKYLVTLYKVEKAKKLLASIEEDQSTLDAMEKEGSKSINFLEKTWVGFLNIFDKSEGDLALDSMLKRNSKNWVSGMDELGKNIKAKNKEFEDLINDKDIFKAIFEDDKSVGSSTTTKPENRLSEQRLEALKKIRETEIALMQDGEAKRKAQADQEYKNRLAEIAKEKSAYDKQVKELQKAKIPVSQQEVDGYNELVQTQALQAKKTHDEQIRQIDAETAANYKAIQDELRLNFETRLNQQLADTDNYHNDLLKKAGANAILIAQIETSRINTRQRLINEAALKELDVAEQLELQKNDIATNGLNMTEYVERQKNEIVIRYAQKRIEILKKIGDEQSKTEIAQLESLISGLESQNSKQLSLKGLVDEKAIKSLTAHFKKLGDSEESAKAKAEEFFTKFQGKMQLASDVSGALKDAFGGVSEELDMALEAVGNIANGFAQGGVAGGIAAAAAELVKAGVKWLSAKREIDEKTIAQYESYLSGMNELIDKQISMLDKLGGDRFGENILKTVADLQKSIIASRNLFGEAMRSGSGMFSHSDGYKANKMLQGYTSQLAAAGIKTTDLSKMTNEQLVKLKTMPEIYSKLSESMRKYIDDLADSAEKLEEFQQQIQDTILGFDFSDITSMLVDSFTDSSIDNALDELTNNVNGSIANMVKNMLARQMLIEPIKKMTEQLFDSMDKGNGKYELDVNAAKLFADGVKMLGEQYGSEFEKLKAQFAAAGIDFDSATDSGRSAVAKGIATASQDSVDENNGRLTYIQMTLAKMEQNQSELSVFIFKIFDPINRIASNTDRLEKIEKDMSDVKEGIGKINREGINIKR